MGPALVGMIAYHRIVRELLGDRDFPGCNIAGFAKTYTDIWLHGALASVSPTRQQHTGASAAHPQVSATASRPVGP